MPRTHVSQISPEFAAGFLTILAQECCENMTNTLMREYTRGRVQDADRMVQDALAERKELLRLLKWASKRIRLENDEGNFILTAWLVEAESALTHTTP